MVNIAHKTTEEMDRQDLEAIVQRTPVDGVQTSQTFTTEEDSRGQGKQLLSEDAFAELNKEPPMAKRPAIRALVIGGVGLIVVTFFGLLFRGNMSIEQPAVVAEADAEGVDPFSAEADEMAELRAENAKLKREMGLSSQSLNQAELDALGQDPVKVESNPRDTVPAPTKKEAAPAPVAVANSPAPRPAVRSAPVNSVSYRAPAPRPITSTPIPVRTPAPTARPQPVIQASRVISTLEPVDPYEMRDRLSRLGSYGQPVATVTDSAPRFSEAQSIVVNPPQTKTQPVDYRPSIQAEVEPVVPTETEAYYEDVAVVLGIPLAEVEARTDPAAILPGETFEAEIINGISWNAGERPEIALETTEDLSVEDDILIPSGTRMLATLSNIDEAGGLSFDINQIFMDEELTIPPGSLVIQAEDGSSLRASRAGRQRGSDMDQIVWGSALNALGNVINSDDSLVGDLAGGVGEAVLEGQRERVDAEARQRAAITQSQASVWELSPKKVQIFVSRYIPLLGESDEN